MINQLSREKLKQDVSDRTKQLTSARKGLQPWNYHIVAFTRRVSAFPVAMLVLWSLASERWARHDLVLSIFHWNSSKWRAINHFQLIPRLQRLHRSPQVLIGWLSFCCADRWWPNTRRIPSSAFIHRWLRWSGKKSEGRLKNTLYVRATNFLLK